MRRFYFLMVMLLAVHARSQTPVWTQFPNTPPPPTGARNDDIYFVDQQHGWSARGTDGIYRTTNGGQIWTKVFTNGVTSPLTAHFRSIGFADVNHGWAGNLGPGSYDGAVNNTNLLYETFNGGLTWGVITQLNYTGMQGFCAIHVYDSNHIFGAGRVRGPAYFVKSQDSGATWYVTNLTAGGVMGGLMDVYFKDLTNGFIVGMNTNSFFSPPYYGSIARTTNGGLSWQVLVTTTITNSYFWKMSWPSPQIGYVSLQQNVGSTTAVFYKTTDGGATWVSNGIPISSFGAPSTFEIQGIGFVSTNEGWMGGSTSLNPPYNFVHTTNGGLNWTAEGYTNTRAINRFRFASPTLAYMSGQALHVYHIPLAATISPLATNIPLGSNQTFTATAYGTPPLQYQWYLNGTNLPGATTNSYSITNAGAAHVGSYTLVLSDFSGSFTSAAAPLTVSGLVFAPSITGQPTNQTVNLGSNATFTVTAGGSPLNYLWFFNGGPLANATNSSYTRTNVQPADTGGYFVIVTNTAGSVTSSVATLNVSPPTILAQPLNQVANPGSNATFNVTATSPLPVSYQWFFNGSLLANATNSSYTRTNVLLATTGSYFVIVSNFTGSATSSVARLTLGFVEDFDQYIVPVIVTNSGTTNGYKFLYSADSGTNNFKVVFGYDYSTVPSPTNIPPAPHSAGTTKGLYLTVNKFSASGTIAALNVYPVGQSYSNNFSLKFDLWINYVNTSGTTEHAFFGINHSGYITNRIGLATSDGVFFAVDGDGGIGATAPSIRDYSVYLGAGSDSAPILLTSGFGPTPPLGSHFDNLDTGFVSLFPTSFYGTAGVAGLRWLSVEVRQEDGLITWLLNDIAVAQFPNYVGYDTGTIMLGYTDDFASVGNVNNFALFDNVRVEPIVYAPVQISSPRISGTNFIFGFSTEPYESYTVQWTTNLISGNWNTYTSFYASSATNSLTIPMPNSSDAQFFRVSRP